MIVRHFLQWVRTAGAADRADATSALARAYLYSDLSHDDRVAAEGAMITQNVNTACGSSPSRISPTADPAIAD